MTGSGGLRPEYLAVLAERIEREDTELLEHFEIETFINNLQ